MKYTENPQLAKWCFLCHRRAVDLVFLEVAKDRPCVKVSLCVKCNRGSNKELLEKVKKNSPASYQKSFLYNPEIPVPKEVPKCILCSKFSNPLIRGRFTPAQTADEDGNVTVYNYVLCAECADNIPEDVRGAKIKSILLGGVVDGNHTTTN